MIEAKTVYFENPGIENTDQTLHLAKDRAQQVGIKTVLVASTTGRTAVKAIEVFKGIRLIIVRTSTGFKQPNVQEFTEERMKIMQSNNIPVITAAHAFGGLSRSMRQGDIIRAPATYVVGDIIASTLRIFGQGMKVACEISVMAADAGVVRNDEEVIAIAGVGQTGGVDTAIVVKAEPAHHFFDFKVKEVICKPRL